MTYGIGPRAFPAAGAIPVEKIRGPIFLDCGGFDAVWSSCAMAHAIADRLDQHGRPPPTLLEYPQAGHGIGDLVPNRAFAFTSTEGATLTANGLARTSAWPRLLQFLADLH
jgi:dienelactone hydrolase